MSILHPNYQELSFDTEILGWKLLQLNLPVVTIVWDVPSATCFISFPPSGGTVISVNSETSSMQWSFESIPSLLYLSQKKKIVIAKSWIKIKNLWNVIVLYIKTYYIFS